MAISNIRTGVSSLGSDLDCTVELVDATGANRKVVVAISQERNPPNFTAPTISGITGSLVATLTQGTSNKIAIYEWFDGHGTATLPSSAGTITIATTGTTTSLAMAALACSGAKQAACADPRTDGASSSANPSFTLTADAGSIAFISLNDGLDTATITTGSGQTDIQAGADAGTHCAATSYDTADLTVSYTRSSNNTWCVAACAIEPAAASGLTITSVTPSSFDSGIAGIVIAGSGFGASQGSSTVDIGGQAQTVTAWGDTSITITSARGSNSMGAGQLKVTIR